MGGDLLGAEEVECDECEEAEEAGDGRIVTSLTLSHHTTVTPRKQQQ